MRRDPYLLAALASAALPGTALESAQLLDEDATGGGVDAALVEVSGGDRLLVSAPRSAAAGADLEREAAALGLLLRAAGTPTSPHPLPFAVPRVVGSAPLPEGGRAVVTSWVDGDPLDVAELAPGPLTTSLADALAAVHRLPVALVDDAGLPVWSASELRGRRLSELDRAASTGRVPAGLLSRWEQALEELRWWRFHPAVVHGDLDGTRVLTDGRTVTALTGWGSLAVGDPADDFGWLAAAAPVDALDQVVARRAAVLHESPDSDPGLTARARLAGEMALARYLLHGVAAEDDDVLDDAAAMLEDLAASLDDGDALAP